MANHAAQHNKYALRKIDNSAGIINHAKPDTDQTIYQPDTETIDDTLNQLIEIKHVPSPFHQDKRQ